MTPELAHWITLGIKGLLFYFIGLPLVVLAVVLVVGVALAVAGISLR